MKHSPASGTSPSDSAAIAPAPVLTELPGQFGINTSGGYRLTAVDGGGRTADAIRTESGAYTPLNPFDKFTLWRDPIRYHPGPEHRYAIQTAGGNYLTASGGGGATSDAIHTDATQVRRWEEFGFKTTINGYFSWDLSIVVASGNYLTATGGGGKAVDALHTDATQAFTWEEFRLVKSGDLGSGFSYFMVPINGGQPLAAVDGGGRTVDALRIIAGFAPTSPPLNTAVFVLLRQSNGSYALRTLNGNFVTADQGGGLAHGSPQGDTLQTNRTQVQAWEEFTFIEQNDATYVIQTVSGGFIGMSYVGGLFATDISDIQKAERFTLVMTGLT